MDEKMETYAVLVLALAVLGWVAYGALGPKPVAQQSVLAAYQGIDASSACGDLNDTANIQHLSHHPDRFAECVKQIDPAKFKEAVGIEKSEWLKQYNIQ